MKRESLLLLGLINGIVSALLFAASLAGVAALLGDVRMLVTTPYLFVLLVTLVGPVMVGCDLLAALAASFAQKSSHSAQLAAMLVAVCLGMAFLGSRTGFAPATDPAWLVRGAFVVVLALPWALGAGVFRALRKA